MPSPISYLCLSDLHLGADTGLLNTLHEDCGEPHPSEVMHALVDCIKSLLADNGGTKPTLVLLGDTLEFALARDEFAAMAFQRFMELTMADGRELFDEVWYVPGNHDHHLWEGARETQYAEYVLRRDHGLPLEEPWHSTRMLHATDKRKVYSPLLSALLRRARPNSPRELKVATIYPNLGIRREDRCVVFHHGHFVEWPYKLFTLANQYGFEVEPPLHVGDLEADNFAWIDFFWSGMGRCGEAGESIEYVYDSMQSDKQKRALIRKLAHGLARSTSDRIPLLPDGVEDLGQEATFAVLLHVLLATVDSFGRRAYYGDKDASEAHDQGLQEYLSRYVREQVSRECPEVAPRDISFVFGHTHSPLEKTMTVEGFDRPLRVFNTGGWIHETQTREERIGTSLLVVDEELNVVSLRLYNELTDLSSYRVKPMEPLRDGEQHSGLFGRLEQLLDASPQPWKHLVEAVDEGLESQRA